MHAHEPTEAEERKGKAEQSKTKSSRAMAQISMPFSSPHLLISSSPHLHLVYPLQAPCSTPCTCDATYQPTDLRRGDGEREREREKVRAGFGCRIALPAV
ncbi:hypothetical protein WAI453_003318 [Rhynchosporium graminicola]